MENRAKITAKLVKILENLASVPKKGYNKGQNYYYMREVDVMEALKRELIDKKMFMLTSAKHVETEKKDRMDKNGNNVTEFLVTVQTEHTFIDSESGEQLTITSVGSGIDSGDKSASKAITASVKFALVKNFMISDEGADIENDGAVITESAKATGNIMAKLGAKKAAFTPDFESAPKGLKDNAIKTKLTKFEPPVKESINVGTESILKDIPVIQAEGLKPNKVEQPKPKANGNATGLLARMAAAAAKSTNTTFQSLGKPGLLDDPDFE